MSQIIYVKDPSNIAGSERFEFDGQINLLNWLDSNLPQNNDDLHCAVMLNGKQLCNTWYFTKEQCELACNISVGAFDTVTVVSRPQGVEIGLGTILAITAVAAIAVTVILKPKIPRINPDNISGQSSSNNQLNASSNSYRPGEAIPDIAGRVVSYPDFLQPSYYEYDGSGRRVFTEYFCIGVGQYELNGPVKEGESSFDDLLDYSYEPLPPGSHPTSLFRIVRNESSQDVDILSSDQQTRTINVSSGTVNETTGAILIGSQQIDDLELSPGDSVKISLTCDDGGTPFVIDGTYTIDTVGSTSFTVATNDWVSSGTIVSGTISNLAFVFDSPWYTLSGSLIEQIWVHLKMPTGIRKGDGTDASVTATIVAELLDGAGLPTGTTYSIGAEFFGNTQSPQYATFKLTSADGLAPGSYRVRVTRITSYLGDSSLDLLTLDGIDAVTSYTPAWGDITALKVIRASRQRVNRGGSSKVNVEVTRKLRVYDNNAGIYGAAYIATRRFCDYAFYMMHELAGVDIEDINTDELYGIADSLSDAHLGYFDFTFDEYNTSFSERLLTCCNAARVKYWNEGATYSFVRDEEKPVKTVLFNRRNLKSASSRYVQRFQLPSSTDGVSIKYVNPDTNSEKVISKRISAGAIVDGIGANQEEIELLGCRNDAQALNRLNLEIRKLFYQNVIVNDVALNDAQLIRFGERCDWVDIYDGDIFDGEIVSVSGDVYTTSERFEPVGGVTYYVYLTDAGGNVSNSVICTARADGNIFGFEASGLTGAYVKSGLVQSGSRYLIASNQDIDASSFLLVSRSSPNQDGECEIELAEYNPLIYAAD